MIRAIDDLTPETAAAARAWLADAVAAVPASYRDSVREDLLASLCEAVDPAATPAEFAEAVRPIGAVVIEDDDRPAPNPLVGRCCGVPYDFRPPTGERLRQAMWNPADPHLFAPRAFGVGWNLNVGALAVRLGLIEPDAEDVPFSHVPPRGFAVAAGLPFALAGAVVAHYAARGGSLPATLPRHWDAAGTPDAWSSKRAAARTDLAVAAGASALAASALRGTRPGAERAGRLAAAGGIAGGVAAITVARSVPRGGWWVGPLLVASMVGGAAAPLLGLALAGRRGEQRRDLSR